MNQDDIIRMAREAKGHAYTNRHLPGEPAFAFSIDRLERFFHMAYAAGAAAEREACALIAWNHEPDEGGPIEIAIRARSQS